MLRGQVLLARGDAGEEHGEGGRHLARGGLGEGRETRSGRRWQHSHQCEGQTVAVESSGKAALSIPVRLPVLRRLPGLSNTNLGEEEAEVGDL